MKTKTKTIRITDELLSKLKESAKRNGVSDTRIIEMALNSYINGYEEKLKLFIKENC